MYMNKTSHIFLFSQLEEEDNPSHFSDKEMRLSLGLWCAALGLVEPEIQLCLLDSAQW